MKFWTTALSILASLSASCSMSEMDIETFSSAGDLKVELFDGGHLVRVFSIYQGNQAVTELQTLLKTERQGWTRSFVSYANPKCRISAGPITISFFESFVLIDDGRVQKSYTKKTNFHCQVCRRLSELH